MKNRIIEILNNNITESKNDYNKIYEKDFDNLANELLEAINYTRCCEELKELDDDNFDDWLIVNGYTVYKDHYMKGDQVFFGQYAGSRVLEHGCDDLIIINDEDILGVLSAED